MAASPRWLKSLEAILGAVRCCHTPWIDRQLIEELFSVRQRRAVTLLHEVGAQRVGGGLAVTRERLLSYLETIRDDPGYRAELRRRGRVANALSVVRVEVQARRLVIDPFELRRKQGEGPGPGITLRPGAMQIEFASPTDLLAKLYRLTQFLAENAESLDSALIPNP